jgi:hypothetical protein
MKYATIRPYIKSGDLLFFRGTGLMAWLVRVWTNSDYSHVGMAWRIGGRILILECRPTHGGVTISRALSDELGDKITVVSTYANWNSGSEERALEYLGKSYGWWSAIRGGFGYAPTSKSVDCAEFCAYVLRLPIICAETPQSLWNRYSNNASYILA